MELPDPGSGRPGAPGGTVDYWRWDCWDCWLSCELLRVAAQWLAALDAIIRAAQVVLNSPHIGSRGLVLVRATEAEPISFPGKLLLRSCAV